jgi:hypothetical protein
MKTTLMLALLAVQDYNQIDGVTIVDEVSVKTPWGMLLI